MKYKKLFSTILLLAALALQANAYTVTTVDEAPQWQIDWSYNQGRPDWQEPAAGNFENWTVMIVKIEEALLPHVSADDMLAIFVDDEIRGLSKPAVVVSTGTVDATQFLLKAYSNESMGDRVTLTMKYYNARLGQVFSLSETITLDEDDLLGFEEDFIAPFTLGSPKYPVTKNLSVASVLAEAGITPAEGDIMGAFVGDECRGVASTANGQLSSLTVYLHDADEAIVLKYYDAAGKRIITFSDSSSVIVLGDATGDGIVDVSDYIGIANYIMGNIPAGFNEKAADVNGDGVIDISDYIGVANIILYGSVSGK